MYARQGIHDYLAHRRPALLALLPLKDADRVLVEDDHRQANSRLERSQALAPAQDYDIWSE